MSTDIGFADATPSLPSGGGAVSGLGETFTPDWSTGGGSFSVRLDVPNGPNDSGPRLALRYDVGQGNGAYGVGFSLPLPRIVRSTAQGYPRYDERDLLMLEGAGELARTANGWRPRVDGGAWRVSAQGGGFRMLDREGNAYTLGTEVASQLSDGGHVFAWHLERIEDPLGNEVTFQWRADSGQLYLETLTYGSYGLDFDYEARPDVLRDGRAGFLITTALRCRGITLSLRSGPQPVLRRWDLGYGEHPDNRCSVLSSVTLTGVDASGTALSAPPLTMTWTEARQPTLTRFRSLDPGAAPGPLGSAPTRMELIDWTGDGLPDLVEILPSGRARCWPNLGDATWGRPQPAGLVPSVAGALAAVALGDLDGDGLADLVRADQPIGGYVPRTVNGGFGRPVTFARAPSVSPSRQDVRFTDLNGDGVLDLLSSSSAGLALDQRVDPGGWLPRPRVVPPPDRAVANLADPRVFLADMTGDGSSDLVRVDGGGVTYWPYLGDGRWASPVRMADPPQLPVGLEPGRVLVVDVDGDGCADVVMLTRDRVTVWLNRTGNGFAPPRVVRAVPTQRMTDVRAADMLGTGAAGLLWTQQTPAARSTAYFFLDLLGGSKPYLLGSVDNGVGLRTTLSYSTSAQEAARDRSAGAVWPSAMPIVVPVVSRLDSADAATGVTATTRVRYHDGRYDGRLREFAGFGVVEEEQVGDPSAPTLLVRRTFSTGLDLDSGGEPRTSDERARWRALRGRLLVQERYGLDGSPDEGRAYDRLEQQWRADLDGECLVPRLTGSITSTFERAASAVATLRVHNLSWDAAGNVTESVQTAELPGDPGATRTLRTVTAYAADAATRFVAKPWRVTQTDAGGALLADTITRYDNLPDGQAGAQGLVTARDSLVLPDALVAAVYGATPPDLATLGYFRRPDTAGWWAPQGRWIRDASGPSLRGTATSASGGVTAFTFDADGTVPVSVTDPYGNTAHVDHDPRTNRVLRLTDASGAISTARYDPLARLVASVEPGDDDLLPTRAVSYDTSASPVTTTSATRSVSGQVDVVTVRERHDGYGRLLERRMVDDAGDVRMAATVFGSRGLVAREHLPVRAASGAYAVPDIAEPHTAYSYDALGRVVRQDNPDGTFRTAAYHPLAVEQSDEEDTRAAGGHAGTPTTRRFDATGRLVAVDQRLGARTLTSTYEYDAKGELSRHVDAAGHEVRIWHDLLGRTLRVDRPEASTVSVFDAAGNAVQAQSGGTLLVTRVFDLANRPVSVHPGTAAAPPTATFTYHDAGRPAPPDAGAHTLGGRCVRVDDDGGATVLDYDERGRVVHKRVQPAAGGAYDLDLTYRADGQLSLLHYPAQAPGGQRLLLRYDYDRRGLLAAVPGVVTSVKYDLAGRRSVLRLANGTETTYDHDDATGRLVAARLTGPDGELRAVTLSRDGVGNVTAVASPDPQLEARYDYDDLYRLVDATYGGTAMSCTYDDAGALTFRTGVGAYVYGSGGAPATCLSSVGTSTFTWGPLGAMASGPWGTLDYDAQGRLVQLAGADGTSTYAYDYAGLRVRATTPEHERLTPDALFAVEDGTLVLHLFDGVGIVARRTAANGATLFLHPDHLGGLAAVTDASGALVDALRYDPWGVLLARTGAGPAQPYGFTGGEPDPSGLLYLGARWYAPELGVFLSPDPVAQDVADPLSWGAYLYCRDNPVTLTDPTGRSFWGIFLAALAIVALVVVTVLAVALDIISFGTLTAPLAIGIIALGLVVGGVIGGLAAYQKGGSTDDIVTGILVGAAVGGWAAFFSVVGGGAGAGVAGGLHLSGFWGAVVAGAVNGAISGAALGFAAGFAGGKGTLDDIFTKMWQGALVGLVTGAAIGGLAYAIKPPTTSPWQDFRNAYNTPPPSGGGNPAVPPSGAPSVPAPEINDFGQAMQQTWGGIGAKGLAPAAMNVGARLLTGVASPLAQAVVVDAAVGTWDLGYVPALLDKLGVIKVSGRF